MNDLERRLHHAARELRSIDIEPPPLATISAPRRPTGLVGRVPALVMPVLFLLGGLAVIAGGLNRAAESPDALPAAAAIAATGEVDAPGRTDSAATSPALSVHQELALIASLTPPSTADHGVPPAPADGTVRTLSRQYR